LKDQVLRGLFLNFGKVRCSMAIHASYTLKRWKYFGTSRNVLYSQQRQTSVSKQPSS